MPALQGYEVQTHQLPNGGELDVLHAPDDGQHIWVPGQQVCELTDDGLRLDGYYSTSDMTRKKIDRQYLRRAPDPNKLYSRTRVLSTTLVAVEGLIQKSFHTMCDDYVGLCHEFVAQVLPGYVAYAAHHAELIMVWYEALYHYDVTRRYMNESAFRAAVAARDTRWVRDPHDVPALILGTVSCDQVICTGEPPAQLFTAPLVKGREPLVFDVARVRDVHGLVFERREQHPDWPLLATFLVMRKPDGSMTLPNGEVIVPRDASRRTFGPSPEAELPVDHPLAGVPEIFNDQPCPAYGTYEDPQWIGLYVCDFLGIVDHHDALDRIPVEERGRVNVRTNGGSQSMVTLKEPGLYRLIATSRKPEAEKFKNWLYREVLPSIRKYGHYTAPGAKAAPTAEDMKQALRDLLRQELPTVIEPIVLKAVRAHVEHGDLADLVKVMTENVVQLAEIAMINREQLELSRQSIELITPSHQLFLPASDYVKMDGVEDALKRAPKLAKPSFGLDHCTDVGKASLWMKRLCRAEEKKVAANAVARIIAKDAGQEQPPLYIPEFRMKRLERDHVKMLMFNPACWARCKQRFLPVDTPTLLFPGPKAAAPPEDDTNQAQEV